MEIITIKAAGFCFGVKRAINIAFRIAREKRKGVYTLGPIIHNPQVVEKLREEGIVPISDIKNRDDVRALIIRTHGIPLDVSRELERRGCEIIDATCPYVKKAQYYAKLLSEEGYQVVILGEKNHPEVQSLMSYASKSAIVVSAQSPLPKLKSRIGLVVQTTQPIEALRMVISEAIERAKELKVYNTICNSTAQRLKETAQVAAEADAMFVVGGKNSANTTQLTKLCLSLSVPTYHIETSSEIKKAWIKKARKIGITAGASTPTWIIRDVENRLRYIGG
jgi:4-hydroxy-3-methylbut-2-enyl diphosphate reductase